jgi:hypothetical protein
MGDGRVGRTARSRRQDGCFHRQWCRGATAHDARGALHRHQDRRHERRPLRRRRRNQRPSRREHCDGGSRHSKERDDPRRAAVTGNQEIPSFAQGFGFQPGTGRGSGVALQLPLGEDPNDGTSIGNPTIAYNVAFTGSQIYGSDTITPMRVANAMKSEAPQAPTITTVRPVVRRCS